MKTLLLALSLLLFGVAAVAQAPSVTLTANKTVADGQLVPVLTWSSSPIGPTSCTASGGWSGTKAGAGTEALPQISASATYRLDCTWPSTLGTATVSWTLPTTNTGGSALNDLKGTRIYYGNDPAAYTRSVDVVGSGTSRVISGLASGTWNFKVRVYNVNDIESADSNVASKSILLPLSAAGASVSITVRPVPNPAVVTSVVVAGVPFVPVFRVAANGTSISSTLYGMVPVGRACGAKISTWRGKPIHRITASVSELWGTTDTTNLAAPCG